jgi:hypothetical protein
VRRGAKGVVAAAAAAHEVVGSRATSRPGVAAHDAREEVADDGGGAREVAAGAVGQARRVGADLARHRASAVKRAPGATVHGAEEVAAEGGAVGAEAPARGAQRGEAVGEAVGDGEGRGELDLAAAGVGEAHERAAALEAVPGWSWAVCLAPAPVKWAEWLAALRAFVAARARLPCKADGLLGNWVRDVRSAKLALDAGRGARSWKLTPERVAKLEAVPGWAWATAVATFEERLAELVLGRGGAARPGSARGRRSRYVVLIECAARATARLNC